MRIGQTEKIYYILPDPNANFEKKLVQKTDFYQMYNIITIPVYSIWYPERQILALNISATVILIFIVFNYFEAFSENMYDQSSMYKMGFPCLTISYVRVSKYVTNRLTLLYLLFMKICPKSHISQTLNICGAKTNPMIRHFLCLLIESTV